MSPLLGTWQWLSTGAHWHGAAGVPHRLLQHVTVSGAALLIAAAIAVPVGLWLGHLGRGGLVAINVSNAGRAVPTFAVLVLLAASPVGFGDTAAVVALVLFAIPPLLTNTYVGMRGVDREAREAAVGVGMTGGQLLRRVEVPLALPLIAAGVRTAAVQVVATATLAALVGGGGLGRFIVDGFSLQDQPMIMSGALLVAALSLLTELLLARVQALVTPRGLRTGRGRHRFVTSAGADPVDTLDGAA